MMSVRTPAVVVSSTLTGKRRRASADCLTRHSSVRLRRSARASGRGADCASEASHSWASGLMVAGLGIVRVMEAVPSGSNVAESCGAAWFGLLQARKDRKAISIGGKRIFFDMEWPTGGSGEGKAGGPSYPALRPGGTFFVKGLGEVSGLGDGRRLLELDGWKHGRRRRRRSGSGNRRVVYN